MAQLGARPGDCQALKALAAAKLAGAAVKLVPADAAALAAAHPFGECGLLLTTPGGPQLTSPNAIAKYLGESYTLV